MTNSIFKHERKFLKINKRNTAKPQRKGKKPLEDLEDLNSF